jgi:hypothetical protein
METTNLTNDMEFNRFGWISMIILVIGCLGGLTVGMGAIESTAALVVVVIPTMVTLSLLLAVAPMKWIMTSAAIALTIDIILFTYYIIS